MKVWDFLVGIVVFLGIRTVMTPPAVSIPSESGVTSIKRRLSVCADPCPERIAAWTAAPYATASSGFIDLLGSLPLKNYLRRSITLGILVDPPTKTTSWIWFFDIWASLKTFSTGGIVSLNILMQSSSNLALVIVIEKSYDSASESTYIEVWADDDKILFAFSAWVLRRLIALGLCLISIPFFFKNSAAQYSTNLLSKSSPPKWVSPAVALTSKTP